MKKNPMLIGMVGALLLVVLSLIIPRFFQQKKLDFIIDNPTHQTIEVQIDAEKYTLKPLEQVVVSLKTGTHILNQKDTFNIDFIHHGVINPTRSTYFLYKKYYGSVAKRDSIFKNALILDWKGKKIQFTDTTSAVFIQDFYYNLNEDFPAWTNANSVKDSLKNDSRVKIFRENDFQNFYKNENP